LRFIVGVVVFLEDSAGAGSHSLELFLMSADQQVLDVVGNIRYMQSVGL